MIVYLARDIPAFVMYCFYGESRSSLLIESTDSKFMTVHAKTLRKSGKIFVEIEADFASPIFNLPLLQISYG